MNTTRNYGAISPSARALMVFKAHSQIPFAKETASMLLSCDEIAESTRNDFGFWASVLHFENRYYSINQLALEVESANILELSSGFSFRGLEFAMANQDVRYIDTDLPDIIHRKQEIAAALGDIHIKGELSYRPLNVLDDEQFLDVANLLNGQPITFINEGLLLYFSAEEKKKLCATIRNQLNDCGGYWITSDIYINHSPGQVGSDKDKKWSNFFDKMQVNQQMFASFEEAEEFFYCNGFVLDKEYTPDYHLLSASKPLLQVATPEQLERLAQSGKVQATWRLKLK